MIKDLQLGNAMGQPCVFWSAPKSGHYFQWQEPMPRLLEDNSSLYPLHLFLKQVPIEALRSMGAPAPISSGKGGPVNKYSTTMAYQVMVSP